MTPRYRIRPAGDPGTGPESGPGRAGADSGPPTAALLPIPGEQTGRIVFDGWPTGAGIGRATVDSGLFPAATNSRPTSAGTPAIERFRRPVAHKDVPATWLPAEVCDDTALGGWRRPAADPFAGRRPLPAPSGRSRRPARPNRSRGIVRRVPSSVMRIQ